MSEEKNKNEIDVKQKLKIELNTLIGKYIPNKIDLENFTNYIYKLTIITLKDADIKKECEKINGISEIDKQGFMRAIHTMALSSASNVMYQTLRETFNTLKNQVDLVQVQNTAQTFESSQSGFNIVDRDPNSTDFDLADLGNLGKVSQEAKESLEKNIEKLKEEDRRWEYGGQQVDYQKAIQSKRNTWSSSDIEFNIDGDLNEFNMGGVPSKSQEPNENFMSDASSYSDGTYTKVPTVDKDLDY